MKARLKPANSVVTLARGSGETVDIQVRVAPLVLVQLMAAAYPPPVEPNEETEHKRNTALSLVRIGYCLTVENSETCPSTPFPDWATATPESVAAYADALWEELKEAGFSLPDYIQLIEKITALNNKKVEEITGPKGS
jgi:hypothetical protein